MPFVAHCYVEIKSFIGLMARRMGVTTALVLVVGLTASVWAGKQAYQLEVERRLRQFNAEAVEVQTTVQERLKLYGQVLNAARSFAGLQEKLTRAEWEAYADRLRLDEDLPGIIGLGVIQRVTHADRPALIHVLQGEDEPKFGLSPHGERPDYLTIVRIAPRNTNAKALGFDVSTNPLAAPAQRRARDTGEPAITSPLRLVQRPDTVGGVIYLPMYRPGAPLDTVPQRRAAFMGFTASPLDYAKMLSGVAGKRTHMLTLTVTDPTGHKDLRTLYSEGGMERDGEGHPPLFKRTDMIRYGGKSWELEFFAVPSVEKGLMWSALLVGGLTLTVTVLLAVAIHAQTRARRRAVALADRMTQQLRLSEQQFRSAFEASALGMAKLTPEGRLITANPALTCLLKRDAEALGELLWQDVVAPSDRFRLLRQVQRLLRGDGPHVTLEVHLQSGNAEPPVALLTIAAVRDGGGHPMFLVCEMQDITQRKQMERRYRYHATHDRLTGLPGRSMMLDRLAREFVTARRHKGYLFALLFLDLDGFKPINDLHGHAVGDGVLVEIAQRLQLSLRDTDSLASRLGGDEFVVLLRDLESPTAVAVVKARLQRQIEAPVEVGSLRLRCGASVGAALSSEGFDDPAAMLEAADARMYREKADRHAAVAA